MLKTQPQFQYYLDNQAEMLQMIEGTVISSEEGRNYKQKAKTGGRAKLVMEQSINVSGAFMTKLFSQRTARLYVSTTRAGRSHHHSLSE